MTALSSKAELERQIAELQQQLRTSADENARLQHELSAAGDRQNASAEILSTIAATSGDADHALQQIAETTARLFGASSVSIQLAENGEWGKSYRYGTSAQRIRSAIPLTDIKVGGRNMPGAVIGRNQQIHASDLDNLDPDLAEFPGLPHARAAGTRVMAGTPLRREGQAIGSLIVHRDRPEPFTAEELALQQSFADQAVIAIENARLFNETREALERQTATADILKVIASSPSNVQPVFDAIASSANRLIGGFSTAVYRLVDDMIHMVAFTPTTPEADAALQAIFPLPRSEIPPLALVENGQPAQIADSETSDPQTIRIARARGWRSVLFTPLMNRSVAIGFITVTRRETGRFADHHIQLLRTFADQAVIAIENARLFNETREALERQTATADILKVIASSPSDVQPVFEVIAASSNRLLGGFSTAVFRFIDGTAHLAAFTSTNPAADALLQNTFPRPVTSFTPFQLAAQAGKVVQVSDTEDMAELDIRDLARLRGFRSMLLAPLMNNGVPIGLISVTRPETGTFAPHHVQLLQTFADQAVIAIENVRLFDEVQARTRDLSEALQRQTATADVLKVISRSAFDLPTVLDALLTSACRLCEADIGTIRYEDGGNYRLAATYGCKPEWVQHFSGYSTKPDRSSVFGQTIIGGRTVHMPDVLADRDFNRPEAQRLMGFRAALGVPLLRERHTFGVINLFRFAAGSFEPKQIEIVETFADQAVIAIENVRLFDEVQAKTRDLTEALTHQTGSANILKVIASSPTDVGPVLQAIVDSACELCDAPDAVVHLRRGDELHYSAHHGPIPTGLHSRKLSRSFVTGRAVIDKVPIHLSDALSAEGADFPEAQEMSRRMETRTLLAVPLLRDEASIGAIVLRRTEVNPFTDKQIALLQTFADQAVIALGNVALFEQVQARTADLTEVLQQQTATSEVLQVISASPGELDPVFETMLTNAMRLCEASHGVVWLREGDGFRSAALSGPWPEGFVGQWRSGTPVRPGPDAPITRAAVTGKAVQTEDLSQSPAYRSGDPLPVAAVEIAGIRTVLSVPMFRESECVGAIALSRREVRLFTDKQVELVANFAKQAVLAVENARLLGELRQRTAELSASLDELRAAQDRLVQTEKLASLGQLTAGIAHEIKNPLNFVNNFSALSVELLGELGEALTPAPLDAATRAEIDEVAQMLKGNLEKVVQHGRRADSIVKNMLLHSREGSGERRPTDINAIVEESLNLAYHGARAEKSGFNITLLRELDPDAGMVEVYPQEITRVFLNLISNAFYAATKRKEAEEDGFEPTLTASTRSFANRVEVRIRDNGTGIPEEARTKIFNPFFTTKPAGEGTGLGLSMSHDIVVKQHGGRIDIDTEPGAFTEFIITLPRTVTVAPTR